MKLPNLLDKNRPIKEQLFYLICIGGLVADVLSELFVGLVLHQTGSMAGSFAGAVILLSALWVAKRKSLKLAAGMVCFLITFVVFPITFLHAGGIHSGMSIWLLLGIVFDFMLLEGISFYLILGLSISAYILIFYLSYCFPQLLSMEFSPKMQYVDILQSLIIVGVILGVMVREQLKVYQKKCDELEKALKDLERANEAERRFLATMSHEIRTPITAIIGMNEMIRRDSKERSTLECAADIQAASQILLTTVNDILDFSKIEENKMELFPRKYELAEVLEDLVQMLRVKANEKDLELRVSVDENIPSVLIGDDVRIRQIVTNLITNAVKYTTRGYVSLSVSGETGGSRCKLKVSVKDTGRGIKPEDMDKLFRRYTRLDERKFGSGGGTGLGLVICKEFLALMNSELEVESEYGVGTTMSFTLEQEIVDAAPIGDFEKRMSRRATGSDYKASFRAPKARILEVDDNETNLRVFKGLLKYTGIAVDTVSSGEQALQMIQEQHYDLIFMDHMMPEMDGVETLHRMKAMEQHKCQGVPVIVVTANAIMGNREKYLAEGFDAYLSKPINVAELEHLIQTMLPAELVEKLEETESDPKPHFLQDMPKIDGMFFEACYDYASDKESFLESLESLYNSLDNEREILATLSKKLEDPEKRNLYRVHVHGLKSCARMVGAMPLSGMAKTAEEAAASGDMVRLHTITPILLENIVKYKRNLSVLFPGKETEKLPMVDFAVFGSLFGKLQQGLALEDVDVIDSAMDKLKDFSYPPPLQEKMDILSDQIMNLDWDNVHTTIEEIKALR